MPIVAIVGQLAIAALQAYQQAKASAGATDAETIAGLDTQLKALVSVDDSADAKLNADLAIQPKQA